MTSWSLCSFYLPMVEETITKHMHRSKKVRQQHSSISIWNFSVKSGVVPRKVGLALLRECNLNITPQYCSLKKDKTIDKLEDIVKKCNNTQLQKKLMGIVHLSLLSFHLLKVYFLWLKVESFIQGYVITKLMFFFRS